MVVQNSHLWLQRNINEILLVTGINDFDKCIVHRTVHDFYNWILVCDEKLKCIKKPTTQLNSDFPPQIALKKLEEKNQF